MGIERFLQPEDIEIEDKKFIISKFPAIAGREIVTQYFSSALPGKFGDYKLNKEMFDKAMCYVAAINSEGNPIVLSVPALVDNHVVSKDSSWEMLLKLETRLMVYNCAFLQAGRVSNFLNSIKEKLPQLISKILTDSLAPLSPQNSQPTKS